MSVQFDIKDALCLEAHEDYFIAYNSKVGAVSCLDETELFAFNLFLEGSGSEIVRYFEGLGFTNDEAFKAAQRLGKRLEKEGWKRKSLPESQQIPVSSVYFTITRECDLACPYCYQGLRNRKKKIMPLSRAIATLDKIRKINPNCYVIITGGEPMIHPDFYEIIDHCENSELHFGILTNGNFLTDETVEKLKGYRYLSSVQLSLDGFKPETHALSRTKTNYFRVIEAIDRLSRFDVPFIVAPTIHDKNLDEIYDIADHVIEKGGWLSPNNLRNFPHDENPHLKLSTDQLENVLEDVNVRLINKYGLGRLNMLKSRTEVPSVCSVSAPNSTFICGTGYSLLDIDWNGEVYPCHLLKDRDLILGNIFGDEFEDILETSKKKGIRVTSNEIPKCSGCKFTSRCAGGCRAGAYYTFNSLAREDSICDSNYAANLSYLLKTHPKKLLELHLESKSRLNP